MSIEEGKDYGMTEEDIDQWNEFERIRVSDLSPLDSRRKRADAPGKDFIHLEPRPLPQRGWCSGPPRRASILPLTPETQVRMMLA